MSERPFVITRVPITGELKVRWYRELDSVLVRSDSPTYGFPQPYWYSVAYLFVLLNQRATDDPVVWKLLKTTIFLN